MTSMSMHEQEKERISEYGQRNRSQKQADHVVENVRKKVDVIFVSSGVVRPGCLSYRETITESRVLSRRDRLRVKSKLLGTKLISLY